MKLGFFLPHSDREIFEATALRAEAAGFDFLCCDDHLMSPFAPEDEEDFGCYEAWTAMAYLAGKTRTIGLSHMVLVPTFRGPALLAKMAATLDQLSNGRLILALGAGWYEREFEAYDLPWEEHRERIAREREAVQVIRALWTEPQVAFDGRYYRLRGASVGLKPLQESGPEIWIAGDSRPSMELAAELGDGWMLHGRRPEEATRMIGAIEPLLQGREDAFEIALSVAVVIDKDEGTARDRLRGMIPPSVWELFMKADIKKEIQGGIYGPPEHCLDQIRAYAKAGVTSLTVIFFSPRDVDVFSAEVLPGVRAVEG